MSALLAKQPRGDRLLPCGVATVLMLSLLLAPFIITAQQTPKVYRIDAAAGG